MNEVLEEMATKVMGEKEGPLEIASDSTACDISDETEAGKDVMEVEEITVETQLEGLGKTLEMCAEANEEERCMLAAQGGQVDAKFVGVVLILEVVLSPSRASPRLAGVAVEHTLV